MKYLSLIVLTIVLAQTSNATMPEVNEDEAKKQTVPAPDGDPNDGASTSTQQDDSNKKKPCVIL